MFGFCIVSCCTARSTIIFPTAQKDTKEEDEEEEEKKSEEEIL